MSHPLNTASIVGRLARDPKRFENKDGSEKVKFTVMVDRPWKNADGTRGSDAIPVEAFIRKEIDFAKTPFAMIHQGDQVALTTSLRSDTYNDSQGEKVYTLKVVVDNISFLEPKSVTDGRLAERQAEAATAATTQQMPTPEQIQAVQALQAAQALHAAQPRYAGQPMYAAQPAFAQQGGYTQHVAADPVWGTPAIG